MFVACRWTAVAIAAVILSGCASRKAVADSSTAGTGGSGERGSRYVDEALGFEVSRPGPDWQLDITGDPPVEGIVTPVVLRHADAGIQVVIQVAPAIASPVQFAERLTEGMRRSPGFVASDPEPVALGDDAVGFRFSMQDRVVGRVAVRPGADGRILMLMGAWPAGAPPSAGEAVDDVFRRVIPLPSSEPAARNAGGDLLPFPQVPSAGPSPNEV